jgi:vancomycin aglycone glucosyltransferase
MNIVSNVICVEQTAAFARNRVKRPLSYGLGGAMEVLISSIGSRGDVQPVISVALELRARGHNARLCVPPDFKERVESFGLTCVPIGPDLRLVTGGQALRSPSKPPAKRLRELAAQAVRSQFPVITAAAQGCDLIVAAGALQFATHSVAESLKIPYVFVAYCPAVLPSLSYPPVKMGVHYSQSLRADANRSLWIEEEEGWNGRFRETLNEERAKLALDPVTSVQGHIFTERPWLASDPTLAPAGSASQLQIAQTGAWLLRDQRSLPEHVEHFISSGEPPVYFGFGSMRGFEANSQALIEAARALGLRSIISRGWGSLGTIDGGSDCLAIDDLSHQMLFPRVAAVVHHGGAGTTTAAAIAGKPQVIVPHLYDQYFWAHRVQALHIGVAGPTRENLATDAMIEALREVTGPAIVSQAQTLANCIELHGARMAADRLIDEFE